MGSLLTLILVVGVLVATVPPATAAEAAPASVSTQNSPAVDQGIVKAADLSLFRPGNIISDGAFFNSGTMSAAQIDAFFRGKVSTCQSGYVCLKDYRQNTPNRAGDQYCNGYSGAGNESAATIIYKVAQSCGINPQVFIVMLQKEQGLVTHTWPSSWRYDMALGQGCPDTAPCDPAYAGFFYQIYGAGRQMKIYTEGRWFTYYAPGKTWNILYNPNKNCGSAPVYIENKATSALYYYTPYQPNRAALLAGYGTGDACSAYGNRNFYQYFTDWFGSPNYPVVGGLAIYWQAHGGGTGPLGEPYGPMSTWGDEGWSQPFSGGDLLQKRDSAVFAVRGAFREEYRTVGHFWSGLGWPTGDQVFVPSVNGYYQDFQGGRIYVRPDGRGFAIAAPMYAVHEAEKNLFGRLGWPSSRAYLAGDGSRQDFDGGAIIQSPTQTAALGADFVTAYDRAGGFAGLGSLLSGEVADAQGSHVSFSRGWLQKSASGIVVVKGSLGEAYAKLGGSSSALGFPTAAEKLLSSGGWSQAFTGGTLYASSLGTYAVTGFATELAVLGGVDRLGYPAGEAVVNGQKSWQPFGTKSIGKATPNGGAYVVNGSIMALYVSTGTVKGDLGAPTGPETTLTGGWSQNFEGGRILASNTGTYVVPRVLATALDANGGVAGRLGWPTASAVKTSDGWRQDFTGGTLLASSDAAKSGAVFGGILSTVRSFDAFAALGYPVEREVLTANGWRQRFDKGAVFVPYAYGPSVVTGPIYDLYQQLGGEGGAGVPVGPSRSVAGGSLQDFPLYTIYASPRGTWQTNGSIRDRYRALRGPEGELGWPVESLTTVSGGWRQLFVGGGIFASNYGTIVTKGALGAEYIRRGAEKSSLGWPVANEALVGGLWTQRFQNGTLVWKADGTYEVR